MAQGRVAVLKAKMCKQPQYPATLTANCHCEKQDWQVTHTTLGVCRDLWPPAGVAASACPLIGSTA
jgi:hypothetical protein